MQLARQRTPARLFQFIGILFIFACLPCFSAVASVASGYDLYSWEKDHTWYYTIVTGKVPTRDPVEIRWAPGRVAGVYELKEKILHLPEGTVLHWRSIEDHGMVLPPPQILSDVSLYAESIGVDVVLNPDSESSK